MDSCKKITYILRDKGVLALSKILAKLDRFYLKVKQVYDSSLDKLPKP